MVIKIHPIVLCSRRLCYSETAARSSELFARITFICLYDELRLQIQSPTWSNCSLSDHLRRRAVDAADSGRFRTLYVRQ